MRTCWRAVYLIAIIGCGDSANDASRPPDAAASSPDAALTVDAAAPAVDATPVALAGACTGEVMLVNRGNPLQCCRKGDDVWQTLDGKRLAHRTIGPPCRLADGIGAQCGSQSDPVPCFYGPCGGSAPDLKMGNVVTIFHPRSDPNACGLDVDGTDFTPEKYDNQEVYPGVVSTCRFTDCMFPGIPISVTQTLSVKTVNETAGGTVTSAPDGISVATAGDTSAPFPIDTVVTLNANPKGIYARAVLSGDCTATGSYGALATCTVKMDVARSVTVTYQCQPGFSCAP